MIIQTILLDPSISVWSDSAANVSRLDPSGAVQADAEHPSRNRTVAGYPILLDGGIALSGATFRSAEGQLGDRRSARLATAGQ
jgi:hypothetical protein